MYWSHEYTYSGKKKLLPYRRSDDDEEILVPCGRCMACRINNSRLWAVRCVCEAKEHNENYYLTFTYDDDHIVDRVGNVGIDNIEYVPTANNDVMSSFMKALRQDQKRKYDIDGIRFLCCSEYGDESFRAHHHMILFGAHIDDLYFWKSVKGNQYFRSKMIEDIWKRGEVLISDVTPASAQYVAKYATKNTDQYRETCDLLNVDYPCLRMSRNPGIGKHYFETHKKEILKNQGVYLNGVLCPLPDYWLDEKKTDFDIDDWDIVSNSASPLITKIRESKEKYSIASKEQESKNSKLDPEIRRMLGIRNLPDDIHSRNAI